MEAGADLGEIHYYSDSLHNYMIIPCGNTESDYRYRMLAANRIPGLLPCSIRHIDGDSYIYYEITSQQTLETMYGARTLPGACLRSLLEALLRVSHKLEDFLLDAEGLVLSARYIFFDLEEERWSFTYILHGGQDTGRVGLLPFAEFLAEHVDASDRWAAACAYRLATLAENPNYVLRESILEDAPQGEELSGEEAPAPAELSWEHTEAGGALLSEESSAFGRQGEKSRHEEKDSEKRRIGRDMALCGCSAAAALILLWVMRVFYLSETELLLDRGGILFALIAAAASAAHGVFLIFYGGSARGGEAEAQGSEEERDTAPESRSPGTPRDRQETERFAAGERETVYFEHTYEEELYSPEAAGAGYGTAGKKQAPHKLYGSSGKRKYRIEPDVLPCVVGSREELADFILEEPGISPMHARLAYDETGELVVTDLNARGGTFVNGCRLHPNASALLEPGDELRLGQAEFVYR